MGGRSWCYFCSGLEGEGDHGPGYCVTEEAAALANEELRTDELAKHDPLTLLKDAIDLAEECLSYVDSYFVEKYAMKKRLDLLKLDKDRLIGEKNK